MKHILLPTDFSKNAWNALAYAIYIFQGESCVFYVLNAYKSNSNLYDSTKVDEGDELFEAESERSGRKLDEWVKNLATIKENDIGKVITISFDGSLQLAVTKMADEYSFDYIVMGTKGASGVKEIFMGSNSVKIAKQFTYCPIIMVPEKYESHELHQILFGTAYKDLYTTYQLDALIYFANRYNSHIDVLHIERERISPSGQQIDNKKVLEDILGKTDFGHIALKDDSSISDKIMKYAKGNGIDMIALIHKEHGFLQRLFREPVVKKVAFHTEVPLLILPEKARS
jgi:nucleotide-binding universal stress UspA family protein